MIPLDQHLLEASELAREEGVRNVEFERASIYEPGLEPASVDVAYSRWLHVHLNKPVRAMRQIHEALKPGGTMVCEEVDVSAIYCEPPSDAYRDFASLAMEVGKKRGVDYAGGRLRRGRGIGVPAALPLRVAQILLELDLHGNRTREA